MAELIFITIAAALTAFMLSPIFVLGARLRHRGIASCGIAVGAAAFIVYALVGDSAILRLSHPSASW